MMATSAEEDPQYVIPSSLTHQRAALTLCFRRDYVPLANLIGIIFQIRDDYVNLQSDEVRTYSLDS